MTDEPKENAGPQEESAAPPAPPVRKNPVEDRLAAAFGEALQTRYNAQGELELRVPSQRLKELCHALRNDTNPYDYMRNLTAVDWKDRIETVYHVCCTATMESVVIKCDLDAATPMVDTVTGVWPGANWLEREVYDLFGVTFMGHPDPRRIMLPDDWEGHPLRKDYVVQHED